MGHSGGIWKTLHQRRNSGHVPQQIWLLYGAIGRYCCKTYFGKNQKDLDYDEAAILIGMLKKSIHFNPKINQDQGLQRRSVVLKQMVKKDYLTEDEYLKYSRKKIDMSSFNREMYNTQG